MEDENALLQEQLVKEKVVVVGGNLKARKSKRSEGMRGGGTGQQKAVPKVQEKQEGGKRDAQVTQGEVQVMEDHPQALPQEEDSGIENHLPKIGNNDMR